MKYLSFILYFTLSANACDIELYRYAISLDNQWNQSIIKKSNCSNEQNHSLVEVLSGLSSPINTNRLAISLFDSRVSIQPSKIYYQSARELLKSSYPENKYRFNHISRLDKNNIFVSDTDISMDCAQCGYPGAKNIKVSSAKSTWWATAQVEIAYPVYTAVKNIFKSDELSATSFTHSTKFSKVVIDNQLPAMDQISFYKLRRSLIQGDSLSGTDLTKKQLIRTGQTVRLIIDSKTLSLSSQAISKSNARIGETVRLYNPKTRKNISAIAIGSGKARILL